MNDKKKILLLGGEGFIGRNIAAELSEDFFCCSVGIEESIFGSGRKDFYIKSNPYKDEIKEKFDVYIQLIDNNVSDDDFEKEEMKLINNVKFPENSHLIVFSSAVIYADPESAYAKRKIKLESLYENYCKNSNIKLTILRLFNIYGKFQIPYKQGSLIANILFNYYSGKPIEINDITTKRDFIYAGDMAKFVRWIVENKFYGKTDLAMGSLFSIKEVLDICEKKIFSSKANIINKNIIETKACPMCNSALSGKIMLTSLNDGLKETDFFYQENWRIIKKYLNI